MGFDFLGEEDDGLRFVSIVSPNKQKILDGMLITENATFLGDILGGITNLFK